MYGSIRKSYGAKKASRENETRERKVLFGNAGHGLLHRQTYFHCLEQILQELLFH